MLCNTGSDDHRDTMLSSELQADQDLSNLPLSPEQLAEKLQKFEGYINSISEDIERLEARRSRLQDDLSEYESLVKRVGKLLAVGPSP